MTQVDDDHYILPIEFGTHVDNEATAHMTMFMDKKQVMYVQMRGDDKESSRQNIVALLRGMRDLIDQEIRGYMS